MGLTFFLAATVFANQQRVWWMGLFLGLAAASRPTYALAAIPLILLFHQRNAKLQLTVVLAPAEAVPGLYVHPDHRRRLRRPVVRSELDV